MINDGKANVIKENKNIETSSHQEIMKNEAEGRLKPKLTKAERKVEKKAKNREAAAATNNNSNNTTNNK